MFYNYNKKKCVFNVFRSSISDQIQNPVRQDSVGFRIDPIRFNSNQTDPSWDKVESGRSQQGVRDSFTDIRTPPIQEQGKLLYYQITEKVSSLLKKVLFNS